MFRGLRPPTWYVQRDIHILVRSFPSGRMRFYRLGEQTDTNDFGEPVYTELTVHEGEVLFVPAGGNVTRYGLGLVEEDQPQILVPGFRDIRQGDFVSHQQPAPGGRALPSRLYQVGYPPNPWHGFTVVTLKNYEQGTRE